MKKILTLLIPFLLLSSTVDAQNIIDSETLLKAMYKKYNKKWYKNLTFTQKTTFYNAQDEIAKEETWYEALKMPEGLIVKIGSPDAGNGFVFRQDSMYQFKDGALAGKMRRQHELLILGFSVYFDDPETTLNKLTEAGIDLGYFDADYQYYIIGNPETKQAWIERSRLVFTKMESTMPNGNKSQVFFNKYQKQGKAWVAPEVLFYNNGKMVMKEEYTDMRFPKELDSKLFDVNSFAEIVLSYD